MPRTSRAQVEALQRFDDAALRQCCVLNDDNVSGDEAVAGVVRRRIVHQHGALSWPHEFAVEELRMAAGTSLDLGAVAFNQVLFAQSGLIHICTAAAEESIGPGDTATIKPGLARKLVNRSDQHATILLVTATSLPASH